MMKTLIVSASLALLPTLVLAQTSKTEPAKTSTKKASSQASGKTSAKETPVKSAKSAKSSKSKKDDAAATSSRTQLRSAASQVASGLRAAEAALSPEELAIAERVYVGDIPCELGAQVKLAVDPKAPGYFELTGKGFRYRMSPVATSTGAVRLEDKDGGAVWLQIGNKSMLMDQKRGQRLADDCMSPAQITVAESLKKAPARSLLDDPAK